MNSTWNLIDLNDIKPQPWKNGGGTTQTLLTFPTQDHWLIRCSVATVASAGPFSNFAGVARWFSVLEGAGVVLTIDGTLHEQMAHSTPLPFSGEAQTDCQLINGTTLDFNLMLQQCTGTMRLLTQPLSFTPSADQWLAVYSHQHDAMIESNHECITVPSKHLAWLHCRASKHISITAQNGLLMQVTL
jgi:environmental stress-induced protein Ves